MQIAFIVALSVFVFLVMNMTKNKSVKEPSAPPAFVNSEPKKAQKNPAPKAPQPVGTCNVTKELKSVVPLPDLSQNFLNAGRHIGVDTVSSTRKNPNLQLRPDIYIEKKEFMFNNSSIEPVKDDLGAVNFYRK